MFEIFAVTNRLLCRENFLSRIEKIAAARPRGIILREKDLSEEEYSRLAGSVFEICEKYGVACILHTFVKPARELHADALHLPLPVLRNLPLKERRGIAIGTSCHSLLEAEEAAQRGCKYLIAGHIFKTDCKKDLPARGIPFFREIVKESKIPVLAIGGIGADNIREVKEAGACGACVMSGAMTCEDPQAYLDSLRC